VAALSNAIAATMKALEPTLKALPALTLETGAVLKRADTVLGNIDQRLDSFERAAKSAEQLGNSGTALSEVMMSESLPRLNVLLEEMQHSSRRLERLLYEISEQPHSLVFGRNPQPPGPGEPGFAAPRGTK
jgi:phospholipid/cholesterol/gamma-HCH transport system substrate-binding protein